MPRALCIVAGYMSLMRRLTGLEAREVRRSGVLSADVSREIPSGMYSTNVVSLCRRGGVSTIGVASSAAASVSGYANTFDAVDDLRVLHCCCTIPVVLHAFLHPF